MSRTNETNIININRQLKDKVFHDLFYNKKNLASFCNEYLNIGHLVTQNQISILASSDSLTKTLRSDLIFQVSNQFVGIIEAMSTLKKADFVYFMAYFCKSFYDYVVKHPELRFAKDEDVVLPDFKIFVLYSGDKKIQGKYNIAEILYDYPIGFDLEVEVITPDYDIIGTLTNQFLLFANAESKFIAGRGSNLSFTEKEVNEFLDSMINKGILKEYLTENRGELVNMFEELNNEQIYLEFRDKFNREEGIKEGRQEGIKEGRQEGRNKTLSEIVKRMFDNGSSIPFIAQSTGLSIENVEELLKKD